MSTLSFVPRSIKRRKVDDAGKETSSKPSTSTICGSMLPGTSTAPLKAEARKSNVHKDNDLSLNYAILVWLSMSDYSLWMDSDLRRTIAFNDKAEDDYTEEYEMGEGENEMLDAKRRTTVHDYGYVQLKYLLRHSPVFRLASSLEPYRNVKETAYASALRSHAKQAIDVRFILNSESSSTRASVNSSQGASLQTGFEVRRNDHLTSTESNFSRYCKADWDKLTLYFENIPFKFRNIAATARMTMSLLPPCPTIPTLQRVQNISFPTRHEPEPDSIPTCKGFALVTLSCLNDVKALLDAWPWDPSSATGLKQDGMENVQPGLPVHENQELTSAKAFGLRICTKARWEELRAEYLLYRQQLVDEINQQQDAESARRGVREVESKPSEALETRDSQMDHLKRKRSESSTAQTHHEVTGSRFPSGCLVFVRHVHPETNRTTLRTLFSRAWEESSANKDVIHYIDYGKNMDSCYVRLSTPAHAELFVNYFSNRPVIQLSGLDNVGSDVSSREDSTASSKPILPELVLGKREEVYWEKVPEKLRKQAMEKLLKTMNGGEADDQGGNGPGSRGKYKKAKDY